MILMIDDYCLQSYYEESVSVRVKRWDLEITSHNPFEGGIWNGNLLILDLRIEG